jgi:aryl-alcohol dehydrogenase-like predicted oxidoreductase
MRYKLLGKSGLRVSELALGTMTFGEDWGWGASKEESRKQFDLFVDAGGNFIDTAVNYTKGTSEKYVGEFIENDRDRFVVATKYTLSRNWDDPNAGGNSRKNLMASLEVSLKRLRTDYIDLYWLHMWDYMTPVEEVMRALDDAVRLGKVRYVGASDTPAWVTARANTLAELRGWSPFVAVQIPYSLADRAVEREILPMARELELAVTPWGILEAGILTGKYTDGSTGPKRESDNVNISPRVQRIIDVVLEIAREVGRSPAQVAYNWARLRTGNIMIPILGARSARQLKDDLAILEWELTPEQLQRLDEASAFDLGFPHGFLEGNKYIFGNTFKQIDNHRIRG